MSFWNQVLAFLKSYPDFRGEMVEVRPIVGVPPEPDTPHGKVCQVLDYDRIHLMFDGWYNLPNAKIQNYDGLWYVDVRWVK